MSTENSANYVIAVYMEVLARLAAMTTKFEEVPARSKLCINPKP